jgi:UDP-N-acetylmuramyl pentapeptide phosphotransferase/UDP-N-acetylglucosamine-1-phosphate transferase
MGYMYFVINSVTGLALIVIYFWIARKYQIIDVPNVRSSHSQVTYRGAGIIFPVILLLNLLFSNYLEQKYLVDHPLFFWSGFFFISIVSFYDDVKSISSKTRLVFQLLAAAPLVYAMSLTWVYFLIAVILFIGVINAYNFMDGINGITSLYSLVASFTAVLMIQLGFKLAIDMKIWLSLSAALMIFSIFNVRKRALCFSGDIGAISIAFLLMYWIYDLILVENSIIYILFLGVYGLDSLATIGIRLYRKENILNAHRSHLYQMLSNEFKTPQILVSIVYALTQLILNVLILFFPIAAVLFFMAVVLVYVLMRVFYIKG